MTTADQRATWRREAEHRPGHLTHARIIALLGDVEALEAERDSLRAGIEALVRNERAYVYAGDIYDDLRALLAGTPNNEMGVNE